MIFIFRKEDIEVISEDSISNVVDDSEYER